MGDIVARLGQLVELIGGRPPEPANPRKPRKNEKVRHPRKLHSPDQSELDPDTSDTREKLRAIRTRTVCGAAQAELADYMSARIEDAADRKLKARINSEDSPPQKPRRGKTKQSRESERLAGVEHQPARSRRTIEAEARDARLRREARRMTAEIEAPVRRSSESGRVPKVFLRLSKPRPVVEPPPPPRRRARDPRDQRDYMDELAEPRDRPPPKRKSPEKAAKHRWQSAMGPDPRRYRSPRRSPPRRREPNAWRLSSDDLLSGSWRPAPGAAHAEGDAESSEGFTLVDSASRIRSERPSFVSDAEEGRPPQEAALADKDGGDSGGEEEPAAVHQIASPGPPEEEEEEEDGEGDLESRTGEEEEEGEADPEGGMGEEEEEEDSPQKTLRRARLHSSSSDLEFLFNL
jgi:hypothetical protein